jgi:transposase
LYKLYRVQLSVEQRQHLKSLISTGSPSSASNRHARILLKADRAPEGPGWSDEQIAEALEISTRTVMRVRQTFAQAGLQRAIQRQKHHGPYPRKIDGQVEAHLIALVCSEPPLGHKRWTLRLLSDRLVELVDLDSLSYETVRRTLKKTHSSPG